MLQACLSQKYVTTILPDSLTKISDASPVYFTHNLVEPDTIRETSEVRKTGASISIPNYYEKLLLQITKISRFTSINYRTNLVTINHLLVNNLLPYRTKVIDCDRPQSAGCINQFTLALIWQNRAIPLYWCLLPKLENSNLEEQTLALQ